MKKLNHNTIEFKDNNNYMQAESKESYKNTMTMFAGKFLRNAHEFENMNDHLN